jgi:phenylalanyl-tRNA synthetase alpha chain
MVIKLCKIYSLVRNCRFYSAKTLTKLINEIPRDEWTNISIPIKNKVERRLHLIENHPIQILKSKIETYLKRNFPFKILDSMNPIVTVKQNFDDLLVDENHPGRQKTDTYYLNKNLVLRTHTSAHQSEAIRSNEALGYLLSADVYRRDEIDPTHYPIFHQMEGIRLFSTEQLQELKPELKDHHIEELKRKGSNPIQECHTNENALICAKQLRVELEGLMRHIFAPDIKIRWIEAYFPFTSPRYLYFNESWEMEIFYNGKWLEVLGCGVMQQEILNKNGNAGKIGWAFGIGLERLAMVLFNIPDIRLFWSEDERFHKQFSSGKVIEFKPFSKFPACYKDISFWCGNNFHENDFSEIVRTVCGDLAEEVSLVILKLTLD